MSKLLFFLKFYRTQKMRFFVLVIIFAFAGAVLSCSLLVHDNSQVYSQAQIQELRETQADGEDSPGNFSDAFDLMERVMTVFSLGSILIVVWGCTSILFFQNISMQKSHAMLQIFGMRKKDVFIRALGEGISFGLLGSLLGNVGGYGLFVHLSRKLCNIEEFVSLLSVEVLKVLLIVACILTLIAFFGSFLSGLYIYEIPVVTMLYGRKMPERRQTYIFYAVLEFIVLYVISSILFFKNWKYMNAMLGICIVILLMLSGVFYLIFHRQNSTRNDGKKILNKISGLSWRFLYTRNKRDALLAATISVGAIIICIALNIVFDFSGMVRASYVENSKLSTAVEVPGINGYEKIQKILDENGYHYTLGYSKMMNYSDLINVVHKPDEWDYFWALVIESQTDSNKNFQVPEGAFLAENYFAFQCDIDVGDETNIFGKTLSYIDAFHEKGASVISYNVKINKMDWELGIDNTWNTVFLFNIDRMAEEKLQTLLSKENCEVKTASVYVDALVDLLSDYLSVVTVVGVMLVLVTGTFFYSMVRSDLLARKKEMYLYQIYGASRKQAFWVVFLEYLMIAWIASFSVVFVTMLLGSGVVAAVLYTHYPMSIPVVLITSLVVTLFVLACCYIAQWINFMGEKTEIIRDE